MGLEGKLAFSNDLQSHKGAHRADRQGSAAYGDILDANKANSMLPGMVSMKSENTVVGSLPRGQARALASR
ncbi:hypothetical protein PR003_g24914 [Phytophthora rubi]|uniref:Uncharacterized protein n=1 Tax=Phytophthora rubi TaxID=129364 RepID=A0A6A3II47_9STRA|nr:hypothetical protein PR002_g24319 [Phytophthora rubi]KAE8981626.1 hypothetical protein PR001_g23947 [Phytophthora rubi]KAE9291876.1 hypothetical protein PR003_g24914 [Phytophthora rubi]